MALSVKPSAAIASDRSAPFRLRAFDVQTYQFCDATSEILLCGMVLFSPWAFGTTEPWSIWIMTAAGIGLGTLLAVKLFVRRVKGYQPPRWGRVGDEAQGQACGKGSGVDRCQAVWTVGLASVTVLILGLILVSALNAQARYDPAGLYFEYRDSIAWLPASLDARATWFAFWQYLGLAGAFWAMRDWLLGLSAGEVRALHGQRQGSVRGGRAPLMPSRLRRLLWLLCLNGALVGLEGIAQRLEGSGRLLFLVQPTVNPAAITQFGPWAYRANAAQYFNLLWPVCLGFWWTFHRGGGTRRGSHHLLLVAAIIMAACPVISTSRGGALIAFAIMIVGALLFISAHFLLSPPPGWRWWQRWITLGAVAVVLAGGLWLGLRLGWPSLAPRMEEVELGFHLREQMFDVARPMATDYPWFGTGAGTFATVFQLYRGGYETYWPAELHNDWLETRITLGRVGLCLLLIGLGIVWTRWWVPGGIHGGRRFVMTIWLAQAGCLLHARWDFPFQIHSVLFLFLLWSAVLFCLSHRQRSSAGGP